MVTVLQCSSWYLESRLQKQKGRCTKASVRPAMMAAKRRTGSRAQTVQMKNMVDQMCLRKRLRATSCTVNTAISTYEILVRNISFTAHRRITTNAPKGKHMDVVKRNCMLFCFIHGVCSESTIIILGYLAQEIENKFNWTCLQKRFDPPPPQYCFYFISTEFSSQERFKPI